MKLRFNPKPDSMHKTHQYLTNRHWLVNADHIKNPPLSLAKLLTKPDGTYIDGEFQGMTTPDITRVIPSLEGYLEAAKEPVLATFSDLTLQAVFFSTPDKKHMTALDPDYAALTQVGDRILIHSDPNKPVIVLSGTNIAGVIMPLRQDKVKSPRLPTHSESRVHETSHQN